VIIFQSVSKQFGDEVRALDDVSFQVNPGEMVLITGHSGSGKTTLMRLLTREYIPSTGSITFNGQQLENLRGRDLPYHRRQLGVVFQDYKLLPDQTIWENIALPLYIANKDEAEIASRVTDLLKLIELTDKANHFPSQLSGGEAQRVSIARALATAPKVLFADEPTGNLDPETTQAIARLLGTINSLGTTIMLATHDLGVIEAFPTHRRLTLEKGKIIKDTGVTEIKEKKSAAPAKKAEVKETPVKKVEVPVTPVAAEPAQPTQTRVGKFFHTVTHFWRSTPKEENESVEEKPVEKPAKP
jgi:cell division transport system ATP-binding protein